MVSSVLGNITNSPKRQRMEDLTTSKSASAKLNNHHMDDSPVSQFNSAAFQHNAENENLENDENKRCMKTPTKTPIPLPNRLLGTHTKSLQPNEPSNGRDPVASQSVSKLKDWLIDFEQKSKEHYAKNQPLNSQECQRDAQQYSAKDMGPSHSNTASNRDMFTPRSKSGYNPRPSTSKIIVPNDVAPSTPVSKIDFIRDNTPCDTPVQCALRKFDPLKEKAAVSKKDVEATNDGYAPVHKLSEWLAAKPFDEKKKTPSKPLIRGRILEKEKNLISLSDPALAEAAIDVSDKKKWLENIFQKKDARQEEDVSEEFPTGVTKIKEVLEKRQQEIIKATNPKANQKIKWDVAGVSHGQYKKKVVDERGMPPKKRLADLP
mmetsp:Transcript_24758/g.35533  ORF Transcript_24758/g.35533 Transcript_24758/m.35533 type:complete len:376 (-) Transcript_24758:53-1180(-)